MSTTPKTTGGLTVSSSGPHHHRARRLRHFVLPNGRKVHIALSPEEADNLRQRLNAIPNDEPFDLVINGSPEHLEALRQAHSHHESRREALKEKLGDAYDEFENVRAELDVLGSELHMLTDHAVSLDANFSKYGYSAHLRTYDDQGTPTHSSASSINGFHDPDHERKDWSAERKNGRIMKIYKKPVIRQYFHRGLLWRASVATEVASFELFVDLLYVGILAINGDHAGEKPNSEELLRFAITFIMSWKVWSDLTLIISWFETDDILQRISVMFIMACLLGLTTNMLDALHETYTMLVAFYLTARFFIATFMFSLAWAAPMVRGMMFVQTLITIIPAMIWIASIHVEIPNRYGTIWVAIFLDLCGSMFVVLLIRSSKLLIPSLATRVDRIFEFYPAINIEHKVERTNAFVGLVFGYSVVAIIYQNSATYGLNAFLGKAVLGLVQAFAFNWLYFELDGGTTDLFAHAIRRNVGSSLIWAATHLPFIMAYVLGAGALSKLVVATDCQDTNILDLTESYRAKSEDYIPIGLRWFYCVGLGIALACMGIISLCHVHKDAGSIRIKKSYRLANRFGVCVILCCLPTAHDLNSLRLISITTSLVIYVLIIEIWGSTCVGDNFCGGGKNCKYTANCRITKKDLESAVKGGQLIDVQMLSDAGEKGMYELS